MIKWYAAGGENGLKISGVIKDHLTSIVAGKLASEPDKVLADMSVDAQKLLLAIK